MTKAVHAGSGADDTHTVLYFPDITLSGISVMINADGKNINY